MTQFMQICGEVQHPPKEVLACSRIFTYDGKTLILAKVARQAIGTTITVNQNGWQYSCKFQRSLETSFKPLLHNLIDSLSLGETFSLTNHALVVFKLSNFIQASFISYNIADVAYGAEVCLNERNGKSRRVVSNCFKQNGQCFYLVNNENEEKEDFISEIVNIAQSKIFGFCLNIGKLQFCLPINMVLFGSKTPLLIEPRVEQSLKKVVYLSYESSHCTGMLLSSRLILTVRHLFTHPPKIGTTVKARLYPYHEVSNAKVVLTTSKFVDLAVLQLVSQKTFEEGMDHIQNQFDKLLKVQQIKVGLNVYAIGFGKHPFRDFHFQTTELLLPTFTEGIVSKSISHKEDEIYFKTDCSLFNGFSGCAIWHEGRWIGNTVFIIKNKVSQDKHAKHNFSYHRTFIEDFISGRKDVEKCEHFQRFFKEFQAIHTRKQLKIRSKL